MAYIKAENIILGETPAQTLNTEKSHIETSSGVRFISTST